MRHVPYVASVSEVNTGLVTKEMMSYTATLIHVAISVPNNGSAVSGAGSSRIDEGLDRDSVSVKPWNPVSSVQDTVVHLNMFHDDLRDCVMQLYVSKIMCFYVSFKC